MPVKKMMKTFESVKLVWEGLVAEGGARQRLIGGHPLHLFYGADASSKPIFVLVTEVKPNIPELSAVVSVVRGMRSDGKWTVVLTLERPSFSDTFMRLCMELVRASGVGTSTDEALQAFFRALDQWRSMFGRGPQRLSMESLRGLIAELAFATGPLSVTLGADEALEAWQGPFGAPQDFVLVTSELFEVKAVHAGSRSVEISSAEQLGPLGEEPLALVLLSVESAAPRANLTVTLVSLVDAFLRQLGAGSVRRDDLLGRLEILRVDLTDEYYADQHFIVGGPQYFAVAGDFPRVRHVHVPVAVDQLNYRLRIAGILPFRIDHESATVWRPIESSK